MPYHATFLRLDRREPVCRAIQNNHRALRLHEPTAADAACRGALQGVLAEHDGTRPPDPAASEYRYVQAAIAAGQKSSSPSAGASAAPELVPARQRYRSAEEPLRGSSIGSTTRAARHGRNPSTS